MADVSLFVLYNYSPLQTTEGPSVPLDGKQIDGMARQMIDESAQ